MRTLSVDWRNRLRQPTSALTRLWRIVRRDGSAFGFTDHDQALLIDGQNYTPNTALSAGATQGEASLAVLHGSVAGALEASEISAEDLAAGIWDGAEIELMLADWRDPSDVLILERGKIGEVRQEEGRFRAEFRGAQDVLAAPSGRVFSRTCDAELGDGRCGVALTGAPFREQALVLHRPDARSVVAQGLSSLAPDWFVGGMIYAAGMRVEILAQERSDEGVLLRGAKNLPAALTLGATFEVTAGCDKRFSHCVAKFNNALRFRGFPHMPGPDAAIAGAAPGQPLDGGRREHPE